MIVGAEWLILPDIHEWAVVACEEQSRHHRSSQPEVRCLAIAEFSCRLSRCIASLPEAIGRDASVEQIDAKARPGILRVGMMHRSAGG